MCEPLSFLIWAPLSVGAIFCCLPSFFKKWAWFLPLGLIGLLIVLLGYLGVGLGEASLNQYFYSEQYDWIPALGIDYSVAIDGISFPLICLSALLTFLVLLMTPQLQKENPKYSGYFLVLLGMLIGLFCAKDAILFYVFFESMLIPLYFLIGFYGGPNRIFAGTKFFLFTFFGSIFLLFSFLYLGQHLRSQGIETHIFDFLQLQSVQLSSAEQRIIFFAFLFAFAIKIPMVPVHTWLLQAHVEAPTGGSVLLAGILLKIGIYGIFRFVLPIVPEASITYAPFIVYLSLVAIVGVAWIALRQSDLKRLIAYSSIVHMGFATLGLFGALEASEMGCIEGLFGTYAQLISHGIISAGLFSCVGVLYERIHSRNISDYGGVAHLMPKLSLWMMILALANTALPGTSGFVGEFLILLAVFEKYPWSAAIASTALIWNAAYTLWMCRSVLFGKLNPSFKQQLTDVNAQENFGLGFLSISTLILGFYPTFIWKSIGPILKTLAGRFQELNFLSGGLWGIS